MRKLFLAVLLLVSAGWAQSSTDTVLAFLQTADAHRQKHGGRQPIVLSPKEKLVRSKIDMKAIQAAGFPVIVWTVNSRKRMEELIGQGVSGIISDDAELLMQVIRERQAKGVDAQGHRGSRNLRPENTLPAMEVALDNGISTLEFDIGVSSDGVAILSHDPALNPQSCRRKKGGYTKATLIRSLAAVDVERDFVCDKTFRPPKQKNDIVISPVALAFAAQHGLDVYAPPTLEHLFDFVSFYGDYYRTKDPARTRAAESVRFNVETKIDPRHPQDTVSPEGFVQAILPLVQSRNLESRVDIQSFDFRTLREVQERFPAVRTVYLVRDVKAVADPRVAALFE
jgi:glycerophosphoryl diester phosphodiesterase